MQYKTKLMLKKMWRKLMIFALVLGVVWLNVRRFNDNTYANYEKAVDYGRVREIKEVIKPVIAAVFYSGDNVQEENISSYINHIGNYRIKNARMLIVPKNLTAESRQVLQKLYGELKKYNKIHYIVVVHDEKGNVNEQCALLKEAFATQEVEPLYMAENAPEAENNLQIFLNDAENLVVFMADLSQKSNWIQQDFLIEEALYLAQSNFYKLHIFDEVDTQLAKAWEYDYNSWFEGAEGEKESMLRQQKRNLQTYAEIYGAQILNYFEQNLYISTTNEIVWPQKNRQNYRLYDRGFVYVRFFGEGGREIFSRAKIGKNKGIIVGIIEIARKAAIKIAQPISAYKIYLLTDLEKIEKEKNEPLVNYLETDDGVYVQYKKQIGLMAADERPEKEDRLEEILRQRAQIPEDVADEKMEFYKFKTVEIINEN